MGDHAVDHRHRRPRTPLSSPPRLTLRPATQEDESFLLDVYASTREEELAPVPWDAAQKRAFLDSQGRAQAAAYRERFSGMDYQVIEADGIGIGRIFVARLADEIRVVDIGLLTASTGRGIGTRLLAAILEEADDAGLPVRLSVERWNPALRFYERLGFVVSGEQSVYWTLERRPGSDAVPPTLS